MLATADIMAQMADRTYLEKLLFLFHELEEARINLFDGEVELLVRSRDFYARMADRFENQLSSVNRFMMLTISKPDGKSMPIYTSGPWTTSRPIWPTL